MRRRRRRWRSRERSRMKRWVGRDIKTRRKAATGRGEGPGKVKKGRDSKVSGVEEEEKEHETVDQSV